ncbi:MAG: CPBP family intramembrane glutamic endopeptidase [Cyanobacteria bacterium P01_H01_bin.153]
MLLGVVLMSVPLSVPLYIWEYAATNGRTVIWAPISVFGVFVLCLPGWMRRVHHCLQPGQILGLSGSQAWWRGWSVAFVAGVLGVTLLYGLQLLLGWGAWGLPDSISRRFLFEGLLVGLGVGLAEELIFRGWLLYELEQDYSITLALWINAIVFAIAHFLRPLEDILATWPQFIGLVLLGLALVWARRIPLRKHRGERTVMTLGPAAGLHGGLVFAYYQVDANDLIISTYQVPEWVTGISGNPLAGLLGLGFLGMIGGVTYGLSHRSAQNTTSR